MDETHRDELVALFEFEGFTPAQASELADDFLADPSAHGDLLRSMREYFKQHRGLLN